MKLLQGPRSLFHFGALALLALLTISPGGAEASVTSSGGLTYVSKKFVSPPDAVKTLAAPCPSDTHVWAGGHYNTGTFSEALPRHSFPYDGGDRDRVPDDGWKVQVSADRNVVVTIYAVCADARPTYERQKATAVPQARTSGQVACAEGFEPVSGGTRGSENAIETSSGPGLTFDWFFSVDNYAQNPRALKTYAICLKRDVLSSSDNDEVPARSQEGHSVTCPQGSRIVGGGVGHLGQFQDIAIAASRPIGFGKRGQDGWEVYLDNFDASTSYPFSVFSTCVDAPA